MSFFVGGTYVSQLSQLGFSPWVKISESILSGATNQVTISSIATGYKLLILDCSFKTTNAGSAISVTLNNDSAANYRQQYIYAAGAVVASSSNAVATNLFISTGDCTTNWGSIIAFIDNATAAAARQKTGFMYFGANSNQIQITDAAWANTADEISRIDIISSLGNFASGSRFAVYGVQ